eukprot:gene56998-biopygen84186
MAKGWDIALGCTPPCDVRIVAVRASSYSGDIAIDDVALFFSTYAPTVTPSVRTVSPTAAPYSSPTVTPYVPGTGKPVNDTGHDCADPVFPSQHPTVTPTSSSHPSVSPTWAPFTSAPSASPVSEWAVRLIGGANATEGRVEVFHGGSWNTVCDNAWDLGNILLDNVQCTGTEMSIDACSHSGVNAHSCGHGQDASAVCGVPPDWAVRLVNGTNRYEGRVEVYHSHIWHTVCSDLWDTDDGDVVCRQLGFGLATAVHHGSFFGRGSGSTLLHGALTTSISRYCDDLRCSGMEATIQACPHSGAYHHNCSHHEDASVVCAVSYTPTGAPTRTPCQGCS